MQRKTESRAEAMLVQSHRRKRRFRVIGVLACFVVLCTAYGLLLPAITLSDQTYCGKEEHTHSEECYEKKLICGIEAGTAAGHIHTSECFETQRVLTCSLEEAEGHHHTDACVERDRVLTCGQEEGEDHTHSDSCYTEETTYICGQEESEGHTHTEACYQEQEVLVCTKEADKTPHVHDESCYEKVLICKKEEHQHEKLCYSNPTADVESANVWEATVPEKLSGHWAEDVLAVAKSQLGYQESSRNFTLEDGAVKGYTRYGDWYGIPYGDWCAMFVSFCLRYAEVPKETVPYDASCPNWITTLKKWNLYSSASDTVPEPGDIIFFDWDWDGSSDHVGLVEEVTEDTIKTIEGNSSDCVQRVKYDRTDSRIMGYGLLPLSPEDEAKAQVEQAKAEVEASVQEEQAASVMMVSKVRTAAGTYSAAQPRTATDFEQFIKTVTLEHSSDNGSTWRSITATDPVLPTDALRFNITYALPQNTLTHENNTIEYQLPNGIKPIEPQSGTLKDDRQVVVGSYTIGTDGKVQIIFSDEYIDEMGGSLITGEVHFDADVDEIINEGDDKTEIHFGDSVDVVVDVEWKKADLSLTKKAKYNDDGTIDYTITIDSTNGTNDVVKLDDVMENVEYVSGLKVTDKSGKKIEVEGPKGGDKNLNFVLPKMEAGDHYEISYTAKKSGVVDKLKNSATATSKGYHDEDVSSTDSKEKITTVLDKKGELSADGKTVNWTITVNEGGQDISGWTLSDKVNGESFNGTVTINGTTEKLPYTFPDHSTGKYVITYSTSADCAVGSYGVQNKATLTPPEGSDDKPHEKDYTVGDGSGDSYNPVKKEKTGDPIVQGNLGEAKDLEWKVTIDANRGALTDWTYTDTLTGNHHFTDAQIEEIQNAVNAALDGKGITAVVERAGTENKSFSIRFTGTLEKGNSISFTYHSTTDPLAGSDDLTFSNYGKINDVGSGDSYTWKPLVKKYDATNGSQATGDETSHEKIQLVDGVLTWGIELSIPAGADKELTLIESLPEGVTFQEMTMDGTKLTEDGTTAQQGVEMHVNGGDVTVKLPKDYVTDHAGKTVLFLISAKITDMNLGWSAADADGNQFRKFKNTVKVEIDGEEKGEDSQTQTITKNDTQPLIQKKLEENDKENQSVTYSIEVNPDGKDLLPDSDVLIVDDELTLGYRADNKDIFDGLDFSLQYLEVYEVTESGEEVLLSTEEYSYLTGKGSITEWPYKGWKITLTVPDGKHLRVRYTYHYNAANKLTGSIKNTARLTGVTGGSNTSKQDQVNLQVSDSGALVRAIKVFKVDEQDYSLRLPGAEFTLEKWDKEKGAWVTEAEKIVSNDTGELDFGTAFIAYNQAYRLIETKAPKDYAKLKEPVYFLFRHKTEEMIKPDDFPDSAIYLDGFNITNRRKNQYTEVEVQKKWVDQNGDPLTEALPESISFELYQTKILGGWNGETGTLSLDVQDNHLGQGTQNIFKDQSLINDIRVGTRYQLVLKKSAGENNDPSIYLNSIKLTPDINFITENYVPNTVYTYEFEISAGTNKLSGNLNSWYNGSNFTYELKPVSIPGDGKKVENLLDTYKISAANDWKQVISGLPSMTVNENTGEVTYYTYYVKELPVSGGYESSVSGGGNSFTITNQKTYVPEYELPATGGPGVWPLLGLGGLLVITALAGLKWLRRKKLRGA